MAMPLIGAESGGGVVETPGRAESEIETILSAAWDQCITGDEGEIWHLYCAWTIPLFASSLSDLQIMRGNNGCGLLSGEARKTSTVLQFNISDIPDSVVITDLVLVLVVDSIYTTSGAPRIAGNDMLMEATAPSGRLLGPLITNLTDALGGDLGNSSYFSDQAVATPGTLYVRLNADAREDFAAQLARDWFAVGLSVDYLNGANDTVCVGLSDVRTNHKLEVTYAPRLSITVRTDFPDGWLIIDDSIRVESPYVASWAAGETHYINTDSVQTPGLGVKYIWNHWSDGGAKRHLVTVNTTTPQYTAYFDTLYQLTLLCPSYANARPLHPDSVWFEPRSWALIKVWPETTYEGSDSLVRHIFQGWQGTGSGSYTGPNDSAWVQMNGPVTQAAVWDTSYWLNLEYNGTAGGVPAQIGEGWVDVNDSVYIMTQESLLVAGAWYHFEYWSDGAGHLRDSTSAHTWYVNPILPRTLTAHYRVNYRLRVFPEPYTYVSPGNIFYLPAILGADAPFPTDSFQFTLHYDDTKLEFLDIVASVIPWSRLIATPGTGEITVFGDAPGSVLMVDPPETLFYYEMQARITASGEDNIYFDDFRFAFGGAMTYAGLIEIIPEDINITVTTSYGGDSVWIDGTPHPAPYTSVWTGGEEREIGADSLNPLSDVEIARFIGWSDAGARFHDVRPISDSTFTAIYDTLLYLEVLSDYGTTFGSGWFDRGDTPGFSVDPEVVTTDLTRAVFTDWVGVGDGSYTGADNPAVCTMNEPIVETAQWQTQHWLELEYSGTGGAVPTLVGAGWIDEGSWTPISTDEILDDSGTPRYFAWWSGGVIDDRYNYDAMAFIISPDTITAVYADVPFTFALDVPETTVAPSGGIYQIPVRFDIPTASELGNISFHYYFDASLSSYSGISAGDLPWAVLSATNLSSGSVGHILVQASSPASLPVEPEDRLCVLNFIAGSVSGIHDVIAGDAGGDLAGATPDTGVLIIPGNIEATVRTSPLDGTVIIDGDAWPSPRTAVWGGWTAHTIAVDSVQYPEDGVQMLFTGWSDGGARSHEVSPFSDTTFTAEFALKYRLSVITDFGTPSGGGYYNHGIEAVFSVDPESVHVGESYHLFAGWVGEGDESYTGAANPAIATVNEPVIETANWQSYHHIVLEYAGTPVAPALDGGGWYLEGDTAIIEAQDSVFDGASWHYFVFWQGAGTILDRYADSTGGIVDAPRLWTAVYNDSPAEFTFGPPLVTAAEGAGFVAVPVIFNGGASDLDEIGFSVEFDTSLVKLEAAFNGSYSWDDITISGVDDRPIITAFSAIEHTFEAGDTLILLIFYVDVPAGSIPLDFGDPTYDLAGGVATDGEIRITGMIDVVVATDFGGVVEVDGDFYESPFESAWFAGVSHQVGVAQVQNFAVGYRKMFRNWSDGGLRTHYIAPVSDSTFIAYYDDSYYLNIQSDFGTTTGSGWYLAGTVAEFSVSPILVALGDDRFVFAGWNGIGSGHYSGAANPANATVRGPITETAIWREEHYLRTSFAGCPGESPEIAGEGWFTHGSWAAVYAPGVEGDYVFHHWEGGVFTDANSPSTQVRVDSSATVTAVYTDAGIYAEDSVWVMVDDTAMVGVYAVASSATDLDTLHMSLTFGGGILEFVNIYDCGIEWDILNASAVNLGGGALRVNIIARRASPWAVIGNELLFCIGMRAFANGVAPFEMNIAHVHGAEFSAVAGNRSIIVNGGVDITLASAVAESLYLDGTAYSAGSAVEVAVNSPHIASALEIVPDAPGSRFRFDDWDDHSDRIREIRPENDTTLTANYIQQYFVEGSSEYGTILGDGWFDVGDTAYVGVEPEEFAFGDSLIYRLDSWLGAPVSESNPCTLIIDASFDIEAQWDTLYRVRVESAWGTAITDGWCVRGDSTLLKIWPTEIIEGESRRIFADWTGSGIGSYSGAEDSTWIHPMAPVLEIANWNLEHMLFVENGGRGVIWGGGWIADGDTAWFGVRPRIIDSTGTIRHVFDGWHGAGDAAYNGPDTAAYCTSNGPIHQTATWRREFFLAVDDGGHSTASGAGWYQSGDSAIFSVEPDSEMVSDGIAWVFGSWFGAGLGSYNGADNPATCWMGEPITQIANWDLKYRLTLLDSGAMGIPVLEGGGWHTPHTWVPISAPPIVIAGSSRLSFLKWTGSAVVADSLMPITQALVDTPCTLRAVYANFEVSPPQVMHVGAGEIFAMPAILYYPYLKGLTAIQLDIYFPSGLIDYIDVIPSPTITWNTIIPGVISPGRLRVYASRSTTIFVEPPETLFQVRFRSTGSSAALDTIRFGSLQYDLGGANSIPGQLIIGAPINVVVRSDYAGEGALVMIDGVYYDSPHEATWIAGDPHEISVPQYYPEGHTRATWDRWDDGGARAHIVAPLTPDTFTAFYEVEHELVINATYGTTFGAGWFREGATPIFGLNPDSVRVGNSEYVFSTWTGTGSGSYSGADNPSICTMNGPVTERANYTSRHQLTVNGVRSASFGSGWFPNGWSANFGVVDEIVDSTEGIRWVFTGWTGAYSGVANPANWIVNGPNTQTANWQLQYLLTIESERGTPIGAGWFPAGAVANFSIDGFVDSTAGVRHAFDGWTSTTGGYVGANNPASVTMTRPITQTAHWKIEYLLDVLSDRGTVSGGGWYSEGDSAFFSVDPETVVVGSNRHVFSGWLGEGVSSYSGMENPCGTRMDGPVTEIAQWRVQHRLTVNGGPSATSGGGWFDHGVGAIFSVIEPIIEDSGIRQGFVRWLGIGLGSYTGAGNPSSCTMLESITETAVFDTSFELTVVSDHGTSLGAGFVRKGDSRNFAVLPDSIMSDGAMFLFANWLGTGAGSYSGASNPAIATPVEPVIETAVWDSFFYLAIEAEGCGSAVPVFNGEGWNLAGWVAIGAENPVFDGGVRYHFRHWSGGIFEDEFAAETRISLSSPDTAIAHYATFEVSPAESVFATAGDTAWVPIIVYSDASPLMIDSIGFDFVYDAGLLDYAAIRKDPQVDWEATVVVPGPSGLTVRGFNSTEFEIDAPETLIILGFVVQTGGTSVSALHCGNMLYDITGAGSIDGIFARIDGVNVEVRTDGCVDSVWVDGVGYPSPYNTIWTPGESHEIGVRGVIPFGDGVRYRFVDWDDHPDRVRTVSALTDTVFEANFSTQYRFGVFNSGGDSPNPPVGNHWFDAGTDVFAFVHNPDPVTNWSCIGYYGTGNLVLGGSEDSVAFAITQPTSIYWRWRQQVPLVVECAYGWAYPEPGTTWFAVGEVVNAVADSFTILAADSGMLCVGYVGTGSAPSGVGHGVSFAIHEASTLIWEFEPAYRLTMAADGCGYGFPAILDGGGFYHNGTEADIAASFGVDDSLFFANWISAPVGAVFGDDFDTATSVRVDRPMAAIAKYRRGSKIELFKSPVQDFGGFVIDGVDYDETAHASAWVPKCWTGNISTTIQDTADGGDSLWSFLSWSDGLAASHEIGPVCGDMTLTAFMQKKYRVRIQKDPIWDVFGTMRIDGVTFGGASSADTTMWWAEGSSHSVEASAIDADGADKRLVWNSWNDGGARAHNVGPIVAPDSLVARYHREFRILAQKNPAQAHGWLDFNGLRFNDTATASRWYPTGVPARIEVSASDGSTDTLWTFDRWNDGTLTTVYNIADVDTSYTLTALYSEEIVELAFRLDRTLWDIGDVNIGVSMQMIAGEEIPITNTGSHGMVLGLAVSDAAGWSAGYGNGENRFALKGRFDDSALPPVVWNTINDGVLADLRWATSSVFGPGGLYIEPGTSENLWLRFTAPISSSVYDSRQIILTIYGHIALP